MTKTMRLARLSGSWSLDFLGFGAWDLVITSPLWTPPAPIGTIPAPPKEGFLIGFFMGYKFKPSKAVAKRFKVRKTGKLKRHHGFTSHLMSARSANKRRSLRKSEVLFEGHAKNMRKMMGISRLKPAKVAHERALAAAAKETKTN